MNRNGNLGHTCPFFFFFESKWSDCCVSSLNRMFADSFLDALYQLKEFSTIPGLLRALFFLNYD